MLEVYSCFEMFSPVTIDTSSNSFCGQIQCIEFMAVNKSNIQEVGPLRPRSEVEDFGLVLDERLASKVDRVKESLLSKNKTGLKGNMAANEITGKVSDQARINWQQISAAEKAEQRVKEAEQRATKANQRATKAEQREAEAEQRAKAAEAGLEISRTNLLSRTMELAKVKAAKMEAEQRAIEAEEKLQTTRAELAQANAAVFAARTEAEQEQLARKKKEESELRKAKQAEVEAEELARNDLMKLRGILEAAMNAAFSDNFQRAYNHVEDGLLICKQRMKQGTGVVERQQLELLQSVISRMIERCDDVLLWSAKDVHDYLCVAARQLSLPLAQHPDGVVDGRLFAKLRDRFLPLWAQLGAADMQKMLLMHKDLDRRLSCRTRRQIPSRELVPVNWMASQSWEDPYTVRVVPLEQDSKEFIHVAAR